MTQHNGDSEKCIRGLAAYFGILQTLHFLALLRAGILFITENRIGFPAPPPGSGWSPETVPFLLAMAETDVILIFVSWFFVYRVFTQKPGQMIWGLLSTTGALTTGLVFALATIPSGAWQTHPIAYGTMVFLFLPVILLFGVLVRSLINKT